MAISEYILREKIYRAYFILRRDTAISIEELSRELGFTQIEDFDFEFERYFAISPENYRNLEHEDHSSFEEGELNS